MDAFGAVVGAGRGNPALAGEDARLRAAWAQWRDPAWIADLDISGLGDGFRTGVARLTGGVLYEEPAPVCRIALGHALADAMADQPARVVSALLGPAFRELPGSVAMGMWEWPIERWRSVCELVCRDLDAPPRRFALGARLLDVLHKG